MWQKNIDLPEHGSICKVDKKDDKKIVNLLSRNPGLTLRQGQAKLKQKGLNISYETIRTYLKANNMKACNTTLVDHALTWLYVHVISHSIFFCLTNITHLTIIIL